MKETPLLLGPRLSGSKDQLGFLLCSVKNHYIRTRLIQYGTCRQATFLATSTTVLTMNTTIDEKCSNVTFAFPPGDSLLAGVMASVSSVLGATANLTAIVALLSYPKTRSHITTPFIVSLAASDFVFSSLTLPILALKFFERFAASMKFNFHHEINGIISQKLDPGSGVGLLLPGVSSSFLRLLGYYSLQSHECHHQQVLLYAHLRSKVFVQLDSKVESCRLAHDLLQWPW